MTNLMTRFVNEDQGQDLLEYALVAGLVALGALVAAQTMGGAVGALYGRITDKLNLITIK